MRDCDNVGAKNGNAILFPFGRRNRIKGFDSGQNATQMTGISSEINLFEYKIPVMLTLTGIEALKRDLG